TFLSEKLSEEVQIKGHTAQQGSYGSYSLVLCNKSLEKFLITKADIDNARSAGNLYSLLHEKRCEFFKIQYAESKKYVDYAANEHKLGEELIAAVKRNDVDTVKKQLCERNKGASKKKTSRTI
ncbi:hypothetical protein RFI_40066, partial [Reticulomyxa filosa]